MRADLVPNELPPPPPPPAPASETLGTDDFMAAFAAYRRRARLEYLASMIRSPYFIKFIDPAFFDFFAEHGRIPMAGDTPQVFSYRGWMLWQVWVADFTGVIPRRWSYLFEMLETCRLPDAPIPRLELDVDVEAARAADRRGLRVVHGGPPSRPHKELAFKQIENAVELLGRHLGIWNGFTAFVDWLAFALAASREPPAISDELNEQLYRTFTLEHILLHPFDYLGAVLASSRPGKWNVTNYFATPHHISEFMTEILACEGLTPPGGDPRAALVCEPCCGTGIQLLNASNHSLRLYGMDVDPVAVKICLINGCLYAPWMTFPPPDALFHPDTVAEPAAGTPPTEPRERNYFRTDDTGQGLLFDLLG